MFPTAGTPVQSRSIAKKVSFCLPPRHVDDVHVRHPQFYGDTGGPGWYAESQSPLRERLDIMTCSDGSKVYCIANAIVLDRVPFPYNNRVIRADFSRFDPSLKTRCDRSVGKPESECSVELIFTTPSAASEALRWLEIERRQADREMRPRKYMYKRNTVGLNTRSCKNILLVREQLEAMALVSSTSNSSVPQPRTDTTTLLAGSALAERCLNSLEPERPVPATDHGCSSPLPEYIGAGPKCSLTHPGLPTRHHSPLGVIATTPVRRNAEAGILVHQPPHKYRKVEQTLLASAPLSSASTIIRLPSGSPPDRTLRHSKSLESVLQMFKAAKVDGQCYSDATPIDGPGTCPKFVGWETDGSLWLGDDEKDIMNLGEEGMVMGRTAGLSDEALEHLGMERVTRIRWKSNSAGRFQKTWLRNGERALYMAPDK